MSSKHHLGENHLIEDRALIKSISEVPPILSTRADQFG